MPLKRKCLHFDEIFITGCTGSCQNDNFQCSQWLKFRQNDDIFVSVATVPCAKICCDLMMTSNGIEFELPTKNRQWNGPSPISVVITSVKPDISLDENFVAIGGTGCCHIDNLRCHLGRQRQHPDNSRISVLFETMMINTIWYEIVDSSPCQTFVLTIT